MWRSFAAFFVGLVATVATEGAAQTMAVRGGEHGTFTRLVFYLPDAVSWTTLQNGDVLNVRFKEFAATPDFSRVYERITRRRLAGLSFDPAKSAVRVDLTCVCATKAYRIAPNLLVIDLLDEPLPQFASEAKENDMGVEAHLMPPPGQNQRTLFPGSDEFWLSRLDATKPAKANENGAPRQNRFAESVRMSAATGILEAVEQDMNIAAAPGLGPEESDSSSEELLPRSQIAERCQEASAFELDNKLDRWEHVARLRSEVVDEAGELDGTAVVALAKAYLSIGFAEEAVAVAAIAPGPDASLVVEMADTVLQFSNAVADVRNPLDCSDAGYLWAVLAQSVNGSVTELDGPKLLRAFNGLPPHLRALIAPDVANAAVEAGAHETAQLALNRVLRQNGTASDAMQFAQARLDIAAGRDQRASYALNGLAHAPGPLAAKALGELLSQDLVPKDEADQFAELATIIVHENRDAPDAEPFLANEVRALILAGDLETSGMLLQRLQDAHGGASDELVQDWSKALSESADFGLLVELLQVPDLEAFVRRVPRSALIIAKTLLDEGLPEVALGLLDRLVTPTNQTRDEKSLLMALANLELGHADLAQDLLSDQSEQTDPELLARVKFALGEYSEAARLYAMAGQAEAAAQSAFLAERWDDAVQSDDLLVQPISTVALTREIAVPNEVSDTMAGYRSVLDESRDTRELLLRAFRD